MLPSVPGDSRPNPASAADDRSVSSTTAKGQIIGCQLSISTASLTVTTTRLYSPRTSYASPNGRPHEQSHFAARSRSSPSEQTQRLHKPRYTWQAACGRATPEISSCALPDIGKGRVTNHYPAAADCGMQPFCAALSFICFVLHVPSIETCQSPDPLFSELSSVASKWHVLVTY